MMNEEIDERYHRGKNRHATRGVAKAKRAQGNLGSNYSLSGWANEVISELAERSVLIKKSKAKDELPSWLELSLRCV